MRLVDDPTLAKTMVCLVAGFTVVVMLLQGSHFVYEGKGKTASHLERTLRCALFVTASMTGSSVDLHWRPTTTVGRAVVVGMRLGVTLSVHHTLSDAWSYRCVRHAQKRHALF